MDSSPQKLYLLLNSKYVPIAQGRLLSPPDAPNWQVRVLGDKMEAVMKHQKIQLVSLSGDGNDLLGRIIQQRGDCIVLETLRPLGNEVRENLRLPASFSSFIYPLTGAWKGRRTITAHDISCGGITFHCDQELEMGERMEVVIPITEQPLILKGEVLRRSTTDQGNPFYALKFVEMCNDEEVIMRKSVFNIQLMNRVRPKTSPTK
jgi:hypothetical protein